MTNTEIFRCDLEDVTKLCYNEKVFSKDKYAKDFLKYRMKVTDDCAPQKYLDVEINTTGTCAETVYTLKPYQNITGCDDTTNSFGHELAKIQDDEDLPFQNPLKGLPKTVTLQVDEVDPVIECGFQDTSKIHVVDKKTLFYYVDSWDTKPKDANFFYKVTVRARAQIENISSCPFDAGELSRGCASGCLHQIQRVGNREYHGQSLQTAEIRFRTAT